MRYTAAENSGAMYWSEDGVGYVLSGPTDKDRLNQVARLVYDQTEKTGGGGGNCSRSRSPILAGLTGFTRGSSTPRLLDGAPASLEYPRAPSSPATPLFA